MNELINQYQMLTKEEKNDILLYNSQLRELINAVNESYETDFEGLLNNTYDEYKIVANNPSNYFLKNSILYNIDDSSVQAFKESIIKIKETINNIKNKIILNEDLTVFRGVSIEMGLGYNSFSNHELFATSKDYENSQRYLIPNNRNYLEVITLKAGTSVIISPFILSCKYEEKEDVANCLARGIKPTFLTIKNNSEDNIILFKSDLEILEESTLSSSHNDVIIKKIATAPKTVVNKINR